jgi:hypothetical protein
MARPASPRPIESGRTRRGSTAAVVVLGLLVALAAWLRSGGLTRLGLYTDDAWAALDSRVGLPTALRMGVTAPGYALAERTWILLQPRSTPWAQLPAMILGVAAVVAAYALVRAYGLPRWLGLAAALVVTVSPVAIEYATRIKEYSADFVLACALLILAERSRRDRQAVSLLVGLAGLSLVAFFVSASTAVVVAGVWTALLVDAAADPARRHHVLTWGAAAAASCALVAAVFLRHLPPALHGFWRGMGFFPQASSVGQLTSEMRDVATSLLAGLGIWPGPAPVFLSNMAVGLLRTTVFLVAAALVVAGLSAGRRTLAPALVLVWALVAWSLSVVPLGDGRTDVVLYPALLALLALGAARVASRTPPRLRVVAAVVVVVWAAILVVGPGRVAQPYPAVDTASLATHIGAARRPGDVVVVAPGARFPWAYHETSPVRIRFGGQWDQGFTVRSGDPATFLAPECAVEPGYDPGAWSQVADGASRVWYVGSDSVCDAGPAGDRLYQDIVARGLHPVQRLDVEGGYVVLLERS